MKQLLRILVGLLVFIAAGVAVLLLFFSTPEVPAATLAAKYGQPPSQFLKLPSGTIAHYRDYPAAAGDMGNKNDKAPVLVLLHGSNASLHTWEPWAQRLRTTLRVVSVDLPGHGLTGATVEGDYSVEGMVAFVDTFTRTLGLEPLSCWPAIPWAATSPGASPLPIPTVYPSSCSWMPPASPCPGWI